MNKPISRKSSCSFASILNLVVLGILVAPLHADESNSPPKLSKEMILWPGGRDAQFEHRASRLQVLSVKNAWDPMTEPFPADLAKLIARAREYLLATREITDDLTPSETRIESRMVEGEIGGQRCLVRRWIVVTTFSPLTTQRRPADAELSVVMLLDGTIAEPKLLQGALTYPFRSKPLLINSSETTK